MKRILPVLLVGLLCLGAVCHASPFEGVWDFIASLAGGRSEWVVGEDIRFDDITDFYYTYDASTNPPFWQRYRFYVEDGRTLFYHETRESDNWPQTEADITVCGTLELSDAQADAFHSLLAGGTVRGREEALDTGDAGPWLYLYWEGDPGDIQEFSFPSWERQAAFEDFCEGLRDARG